MRWAEDLSVKVLPTKMEQHSSLLFNICHLFHLLRRLVRQFTLAPSGFTESHLTWWLVKPRESKSVQTVLPQTAETQAMINDTQVSLPSAVQCKMRMSALWCKNWNDVFVVPQKQLTDIFTENYNPLADQSQGRSLWILSQHLAPYSAELHKPSSREPVAKGVPSRPHGILIMEQRTRYSDRWWQAALMDSLTEACLGEWSFLSVQWK